MKKRCGGRGAGPTVESWRCIPIGMALQSAGESAVPTTLQEMSIWEEDEAGVVGEEG